MTFESSAEAADMLSGKKIAQSARDQNLYYQSNADIYELVWGREIHTGLFRSGNETLEEATRAMTMHLAKLAGICKGTTVLNLGCGSAYSDCQIAAAFNSQHTAVDICNEQLVKAQAHISESHCERMVELVAADMQDYLGSPGNFDVVWLQQSLFHVYAKSDVIARAYDTLKRKGVLVLEDTICSNPCSREEVDEIFGGRTKSARISTVDEYTNLLLESGFEIGVAEDHSENLQMTYQLIIDHIRELESDCLDRDAVENWKRLRRGFDRSQQLVIENKLGVVAITAYKR